jgi:hypothetical protein
MCGYLTKRLKRWFTHNIMNCGFGFTLKDSIKVWWRFAKRSKRSSLILFTLLVTYSIAAVFATPLFLFWLSYYSALIFIFKGEYSLQLKGKPIKRPLVSLLWFLIVIEPRLRAIDSIEAARDAHSRKLGYKNISYVRLLVKARLIGWLFYNITAIPFTYVKHLNLWVLLMDDNVPGSVDDFRKLMSKYFIQSFN